MPHATRRSVRAALAGGLAAGLALTAAPSASAAPPREGEGPILAPGSAEGIAETVAGMSVTELVQQMSFVNFAGTSADDPQDWNTDQYGVDTPAEVVAENNLGGVLLFADNVTDPTGVAELTNGLQAASVEHGSGIPLAITIDQEGGIVARIKEPATVFPGNMALGATRNTDLARSQGEVLGEELAAVGVNVDFAPDADVNTNPDNPVIGVRSAGSHPELVSDITAAQIEGMQSAGIAAAAKHFPGHGDTATDSHTGLPIVTYDRATLDEHLKPFRAAIEAGTDMIMSAHIIVEAIDPALPGTLSPDVLTGLLREELGYDGIITTDALNMEALKQIPGNPLTDGEIAVLAVEAGSDILLYSADPLAAIDAVVQAVDDPDHPAITRERLKESVTRILEWKLERGIWEDPMVDVGAVMDTVGTQENLAVASQVGQEAVTLLRNEENVLPLDAGDDSLLMVGAGSGWPERMGPILSDRGFDVEEVLEDGSSPTDGYIEKAVAAAADHDAIIFTSNNASGNEAQQRMVAALAQTGTPVIVVATQSPYDVNAFPDAAAVLNTYSIEVVAFEGAVAAIAGDVNPSGQLPVDVPTADGEGVLLPFGFGMHYSTRVTPEPVTFTDEPGTEDDSFTIPETEGVEYLLGDTALPAGTYGGAKVRGAAQRQLDPGTYQATGTVTIRAEALEGYVIADGATSEWSHTFSSAGAVDEPTTGATEGPGGELPSTGAQVGWIVGIAVVLLLVGVGAVLLRRRGQH